MGSLEQLQILSGIHIERHFVELFCGKTNQFVGSNPDVKLTRQTWTCGQRSSRGVGSKRQAPAFYFPMRICYMFRTSKCRGELDLGLCTLSRLAKRMWLCSGDFRRILRPIFFVIRAPIGESPRPPREPALLGPNQVLPWATDFSNYVYRSYRTPDQNEENLTRWNPSAHEGDTRCGARLDNHRFQLDSFLRGP